MPQNSKKRLILLDSHAIIHRAYHALPDFASSSGEPTGALYGLSTMLMSLIKEFNPDYIVAAFDLPKPTYRHKAYADYKSGRKAIDENLITQIKKARDVLKAFSIPIYEKEGFEADDVIGTIVEETKNNKDLEIIIASGDMDTLQLVEKSRVKVFTLKKGIKDTVLYDEPAVKERFNFAPALLTDYKGLRGDASDNIIGIQGIGEKTATTLISTFGTIEKMYAKLKKDEQAFRDVGISPRMIGLLKDNEDEATFSKMLATIRRDAPINFKLSEVGWRDDFSPLKLVKLFTDLEFRSLTIRASEMFGLDSDKVDSAPQDVDQKKLEEATLALWILDSNYTNPTIQDIFHYTKTDDFKKSYESLLTEIKKQNLSYIYDELEKPLIPLLALMKENGIAIDKGVFATLSKEYHAKLKLDEASIWKQAGEEFNINSPKQMAEVLFQKMKLTYKGMRKTSSGSYSTKEEVLHKLADEGHEIVNKILEYRELQKLLSTYIDVIPKLADKNSRVHPTFIQTGATTGRMASTNPSIQNIPTRTENGRRIRNGFVSEKGFRLVAFDYSQIELRIAAILSGDEKMLKSFKEGTDIHTDVASYVFDVSADKVDKEMRSKAKTINFGILYGMGVGALQKNLNTTRTEAQKFYNEYFETFTTLAKYLNEVKSETARKGYTETLFGRRRYFEGINSSLPFIRAQAERMAINAPIQGTSADILKIAMGKIYAHLQNKGLLSSIRPLLQIHDELIYEVKEDMIEDFVKEARHIMENILTKEQSKGIPLVTNASFGKSWGELKVV